MKHKTRILTLRTISVLVLVALLAALSPPSLHTGSVALAQTGPKLELTSAGPTSILIEWTDEVATADSYRLIRWNSGANWADVEDSPFAATTTSYTDTGLTTGTRYFYLVTAVTGGIEGPWSDRQSAVPGSLDAPTLMAMASIGQIDLTWTDVSGAVSYNLIFWTSGEASWVELDGGAIHGTSYSHTSLTNGAEYFYQVRAVNAANTRSDWSDRIARTVPQPGTPGAPTSVNAAFGDAKVTLTWAAPTDAGGSDITSYKYRYGEMGGTLSEWEDVGLDLTATIGDLTNGTPYVFEVQAVNSVGAGMTGSDSATPATVPDPPTLTATAGYRSIVLSWTAPANGGAAITSYRIERENDDGTWTSTGGRTLPGTVLTWTASGLDDSVEYTYRIFAANIVGDSDWTSASALTLANPIAAPAAPVGISSTAGSGSVTLTWSAPVFNGGAAVTGYEYRYQKDDSDRWTSFTSNNVDLANRTVTVSGLTPGDAYDFEVAAVNTQGRGEAAEETQTPDPIRPTQEPSITVHLGSDSANSDREQIEISWSPIADSADGGVTNFEDAQGNPNRENRLIQYEVEWKVGDGEWMTTNLSEVDDTAGTLATPRVVAYHPPESNGTPLDPGTTYTYRVRAINSADADTAYGESPDDENAQEGQYEENGDWSAERSVKTAAIAPDAPEFEAVAPAGDLPGWGIDSNAITIRWTKPMSDGGAELTSYQIEVRPVETDMSNAFIEDDPDNSGQMRDKLDNTRISNLPPSRLEYTLSGLKSEQGYFFRIRALNDADGDGRPGEHPDDPNQPDTQIVERSDWMPNANFPVATTSETALGTHGAPSMGTPDEDSADLGTIVVSWTAPTVQGNLSPITRYEIQFIQRDETTVTNDDEVANDLAALNAAEAADNAAILVPTPPTNTSYRHTDLPGGKRYVYRVRAVNSSGAGPWSTVEANDVTSTDARDPDAPMLTATTVGATEILLEWNMPNSNGTPIAGYEIQRWDPGDHDDTPSTPDGGWSDTDLLAGDGDTENTTEFTVENLAAATTYYFRIRATWTNQDTGGVERGWSATARDDGASATTASGAPSAPSLTAESGEDAGSIELTISGTSGATSLELQRYENGAWNGNIRQPAADAETYTDSNLTPGVKYYYGLRASNSFGTSGWSDVVNAVATAGNPDKITTLTVSAESETSLRLTWTAPANNGTAITGYQIQKWGGSVWNASDTDLPGATSSTYTATQVIDVGLTAGETYYYRIRALPQVDDEGMADDEAGWSAEDELAESGDDAPEGATAGTTSVDGPDAPTVDDTPDVTANSITISWTLLIGDAIGGSDIERYEVYKWNGSSWVHEAYEPATATEYEDTGLAAGTTHYYLVRGENGFGPGDWSRVVTAITTAGDISAPMLTATVRSTTAIQLTWNVPAANGNSIEEYTIERWNGTAFAPLVDTDDDGDFDDNDTATTVDDTITLYVDSGLAAGEQQWYQVRADGENPGGSAVMSAFSAVATATTTAAVPDRVVMTTPVPDDDITHDSIKLTWTEPEDNGSAIIHYEVQLWNATTHTWSRVALISATHTNYTHRSLDAETRYIYRVRAQNRAPNTDGFGSFSTILSVTTVEEPEE